MAPRLTVFQLYRVSRPERAKPVSKLTILRNNVQETATMKGWSVPWGYLLSDTTSSRNVVCFR